MTRPKPNIGEPNTMELLAPAGGEKAFFAAVEAGANAVYLGLSAFNARLRAENFSLAELETILPYAHEKGVRIYVAMNTLFKQSEIRKILEVLSGLETLGPDAIICQDLGMAYLIRKFFPGLAIHASTQMTIHNSAGVSLAMRMGFDRVILARECTLDEISAIALASPIPIEVFVHGALCFSYSGQCYFSSYFGGWSANRGRCKQACRRAYTNDDQQGAFFSLPDLCLIEFLTELRNAGVAAIKIEGRLRSDQYVKRVVTAYREALDKLPAPPPPDAIQQAYQDFGREKTAGYISGPPFDQMIYPNRISTAGQILGRVSHITPDGMIRFETSFDVFAGDRIRITGCHEGEAQSFPANKVISRPLKGKGVYLIEIETPNPAKMGDFVYRVGMGNEAKYPTLAKLALQYRRRTLRPHERRQRAKELIPALEQDVKRMGPGPRHDTRPIIRVALPSGARDIIRLIDSHADEYIVPFAHRELSGLPRQLRSKIILRLPWIIQEGDIGRFAKIVEEQFRLGYRRWLVGNLSHFRIMEPFRNVMLMADFTLHITNAPACLALFRLGIQEITLSIETDMHILADIQKAALNAPLELVVYGRPPLFTSRANVPLKRKKPEVEVESEGNEFLVETHEGLTVVTPQVPFCISGVVPVEGVKELHALRIEMSPHDLKRSRFDHIRQAIKEWKPLSGTRSFNYKRGGLV